MFMRAHLRPRDKYVTSENVVEFVTNFPPHLTLRSSKVERAGQDARVITFLSVSGIRKNELIDNAISKLAGD